MELQVNTYHEIDKDGCKIYYYSLDVNLTGPKYNMSINVPISYSSFHRKNVERNVVKIRDDPRFKHMLYNICDNEHILILSKDIHKQKKYNIEFEVSDGGIRIDKLKYFLFVPIIVNNFINYNYVLNYQLLLEKINEI